MGEEKRPEGEVLDKAKAKPKAKRPSLYKVVLHNDDYTTMDFVVNVLETVFEKQPAEAFRIMMKVHREGFGVCGTYTYEVAETKVALVHEMARDRGFPLRASMEES